MIDGATPKSMSATHAGSTSDGNLCHLLVRRARNVAMSKSVAPVAVIRWLSAVARTATGRRPSEDLASGGAAIDSRHNTWRAGASLPAQRNTCQDPGRRPERHAVQEAQTNAIR